MQLLNLAVIFLSASTVLSVPIPMLGEQPALSSIEGIAEKVESVAQPVVEESFPEKIARLEETSDHELNDQDLKTKQAAAQIKGWMRPQQEIEDEMAARMMTSQKEKFMSVLNSVEEYLDRPHPDRVTEVALNHQLQMFTTEAVRYLKLGPTTTLRDVMDNFSKLSPQNVRRLLTERVQEMETLVKDG
ncbi:hypothetical protein FRB96_001722 [Tulasnella sp. 330]|nr:hypothetical protein FRB96_001722 [Tulasnella sp. 330]KAG8882352.1 hypothetical protein FRB97_008366 [Tulasnella sp. 331]KAG8886819.1 hypothetical protein FRB98_000955 [Tulasnella sp. 332]